MKKFPIKKTAIYAIPLFALFSTAIVLAGDFNLGGMTLSPKIEWGNCIQLNNFLSRQMERAAEAEENFIAATHTCSEKPKPDACVEKFKRKWERAQQDVQDAQEEYIDTCVR